MILIGRQETYSNVLNHSICNFILPDYVGELMENPTRFLLTVRLQMGIKNKYRIFVSTYLFSVKLRCLFGRTAAMSNVAGG